MVRSGVHLSRCVTCRHDQCTEAASTHMPEEQELHGLREARVSPTVTAHPQPSARPPDGVGSARAELSQASTVHRSAVKLQVPIYCKLSNARGGVQQPVAACQQERVNEHLLAFARVRGTSPAGGRLLEGYIGLGAQHIVAPSEGRVRPALHPVGTHLRKEGGRVRRDEDAAVWMRAQESVHVRLVLEWRDRPSGRGACQVAPLVRPTQVDAEHGTPPPPARHGVASSARAAPCMRAEQLQLKPAQLGENAWLEAEICVHQPVALAPMPPVPAIVVHRRLILARGRLGVVHAIVVCAHGPRVPPVHRLSLLAAERRRGQRRRRHPDAHRSEVVLERIGPSMRVEKGRTPRVAHACVLARGKRRPHDVWKAAVQLAVLHLGGWAEGGRRVVCEQRQEKRCDCRRWENGWGNRSVRVTVAFIMRLANRACTTIRTRMMAWGQSPPDCLRRH
eukprot:scaffold234636_cov37-Tisochrysis_lutea.AAC.2